MRLFSAEFAASLGAARDNGIAPIWFAWIQGKDRQTALPAPLGFWSGDEDITVTVETPDGGSASRPYVGGCNLRVEGLQYVADLTDNAVTLNFSQIADAAQQLIRGYDVRLATVEIHATTWAGGIFSSPPQIQWVGIVDEGPIATPSFGGDGGIALSVRSEIMTQLQAINPAKSSDAHQKRRRSGDRFCELASTISNRNLDWFKG